MFLGWSVQAAAVTIDFEEFSVGQLGPIQSQGYSVGATGSGGPYCTDITCHSGAIVAGKRFGITGAEVPSVEGVDMDIGFSRIDGSSFALYSVDLGGVWSSSSEIAGWLPGGGIIMGTVTDLGTGDWLNIKQAAVHAGTVGYCCGIELYGDIDNIVVGAAVPIPAAVWLFGSGLTALGFVRRRKS